MNSQPELFGNLPESDRIYSWRADRKALIKDHACFSLIRELAAKRASLGLSQIDLNEIIGLTEGQISKWEAGVHAPNLLNLMDWCQALNMKLEITNAT